VPALGLWRRRGAREGWVGGLGVGRGRRRGRSSNNGRRAFEESREGERESAQGIHPSIHSGLASYRARALRQSRGVPLSLRAGASLCRNSDLSELGGPSDSEERPEARLRSLGTQAERSSAPHTATLHTHHHARNSHVTNASHLLLLHRHSHIPMARPGAGADDA
jgi:hypothetical protein